MIFNILPFLLQLSIKPMQIKSKTPHTLFCFNASTHRYGVATIDKVPDGFSPLAEVWGKGRNRDPLLVSFLHPIDWVVTLPSQDVNGEDGTIQAGEYARGDTATFFVYAEGGKVDVSTR